MNLSELKPICGIYTITNTRNGKVYVGQSNSIVQRWAQHATDLSRSRHSCKPLQDDFILMGLENFVANIVCECNQSELLYRELQRSQNERTNES